MQREDEVFTAESEALEQEYGSEFERTIVQDERASGIPVLEGRLIRKEYVRRYLESQPSAKLAASSRA